VSADFQNPKNHEFFKDCHKMSRQVGEGKVKQLRDGLMRVQTSAHETLLALLKASKEDTLAWMRQSLQLNVEAAKDQPNRLAAASPGMLLNLGSVMLRLCRPFLSDPAKLSKVDWAFLTSADGLATFPTDDMRLLQLTEDERARLLASGDTGVAGKEFNFISQSFFYCWRALHIGVVSEVDQYRNIVRRLSHYSGGLATGDPNSVQALTFKLLADVHMMSPDLVKDLLEFTEGACGSLMEQLEGPAGSGKEPASSSSSGDDWMLPRSSCPPAVLRLLTTIPEHLITDVMEILLFVAKTQPTQLCTSRLDSVLSLTVYFLRRPWAVTSPHLRAKFGQVLYYIFLPVANMPGEERWSGEAPRDGNHSSLLGTLVTAQNNLAPALLLLYGDVEKTGYYEKLTHRRHIMVVLKHLWMLPTHRPAFRGIAKSSSGAGEEGADGQDDGAEVSYFIRFANGLLNETNSLVAQTVELLGDIRTSDAIRNDASVWGSMNEEARETHQSRFGEAEQQVAGAAGLCLETLDFMSFLCSDEEIRMPFLIDEILQRFVSMLTNVLSRFTGSKSMELKVAPERWAQYKFNPKQMLMRVCQTMGYFKEFAPFCDAMAKDGFYGDGSPLKKAIGTVIKYNMLTPAEVANLTELLERTEKAQKASLDLDTLLDDAPDEFLDPLLLTLMRDPVKLPTSGNTVDRSTIATQLLNNELDPFNRQPLQLKDVVPDVELKTKIDEWLRSKGVEP
jgi:ubiquitin conjugation factor E4 B